MTPFMTMFLRRLFSGKDAVSAVGALYESLCKENKIQKILSLGSAYMKNQLSITEALSRVHELKADANPFTLNLIFLLFCWEALKKEYETKKIPDAVYWDTARDLTCKVNECKRVNNVWGVFSPAWYDGFFKLERFGLGRFQYEAFSFPFSYYEHFDVTLLKGDRVLNMHIPSMGPLTKDNMLISLKKAYAFFCYRTVMPVCCTSWLLYPPYIDVWAPKGGIETFVQMFDILDTTQTPSFDDDWRIFGKKLAAPFDSAPQETFLQRSMLHYIRNGGSFGTTTGILLFDGQKIVR